MVLDVQPSLGSRSQKHLFVPLRYTSGHGLAIHDLIELRQCLSLPCRLQVQWIDYSVLQDKLALSRLSGLSPDFWSPE